MITFCNGFHTLWSKTFKQFGAAYLEDMAKRVSRPPKKTPSCSVDHSLGSWLHRQGVIFQPPWNNMELQSYSSTLELREGAAHLPSCLRYLRSR